MLYSNLASGWVLFGYLMQRSWMQNGTDRLLEVEFAWDADIGIKNYLYVKENYSRQRARRELGRDVGSHPNFAVRRCQPEMNGSAQI